MALTTTQQVQATYLTINRVALNDAATAAVAASIDGGSTTMAAYQAGLIAQAATTTTAAFAVATFIEGVVPTSARIDSLTAFAKLQNDYYTNVLKSANAALGAYEALGKAFAADPTTSATFAARYGALSTTDFVTTAYASIFDVTPVPTAGALANLVSQVNYFTNLYTQAGIPAADAALQAKGAVLGQIIGYAVTGPDAVGAVADPSNFDNDVGTGIETLMAQAALEARNETPTTIFGIATLGKTIVITGDVGPAAGGALMSTQFGDKITGTLGVTTFEDTTKIDGAIGLDTLTVTTAAAKMTYAPAADIVKNVEKLTIITAGADHTATLTNIKGLTDVTLGAASTNKLTLVGVDSATNLHVATATAADLVVGYATAPAVAKVSVDLAGYTGHISFTDAAVKSATVNATVAGATVGLNDAQLETLTITSKGDVIVKDVGTGLKTLDLSGVGTFSNVDLKMEGFTNAVTVTLGKGADMLVIDANMAHTITLGAGADTVVVNQAGNITDVTSAATVIKGMAVIADFSKTDDILSVDNGPGVGTQKVLNGTQLAQVAAAADIKAAAGLAASFGATGDWTVFNLGADAYALYNAGAAAFDAGDTLIKITGVQVADLTAAHFSVI